MRMSEERRLDCIANHTDDLTSGRTWNVCKVTCACVAGSDARDEHQYTCNERHTSHSARNTRNWTRRFRSLSKIESFFKPSTDNSPDSANDTRSSFDNAFKRPRRRERRPLSMPCNSSRSTASVTCAIIFTIKQQCFLDSRLLLLQHARMSSCKDSKFHSTCSLHN